MKYLFTSRSSNLHLPLAAALALALILTSAPAPVLADEEDEVIYELEDFSDAIDSAEEDLLNAQTKLKEARQVYQATQENYEKTKAEVSGTEDEDILDILLDCLKNNEERVKTAEADVAKAEEACTKAKSDYQAFTNLGENENIKIIIQSSSFTYTGDPIELDLENYDVFFERSESVKCPLYEDVDYKVTYEDNVNAGTAVFKITGIGDWSGTKTATFKITKGKSSIKLAAQSKAYTGMALMYSGKVTRTGSTGKITYTYYSDAKCTKTVKAANVIKPRTYYVKATLKADKNCKGAKSKAVKFTITKGKNPLTVKASKKTIKYSALKKAEKTASPLTVSKAQGTVTYTISKWTTKNAKNYFTINAKNGKVTAKKGTPKGTYKFKVKVTAKGKGYYKAGSKTVTVQIVVK